MPAGTSDSLLDRMIARLSAQRTALNWALDAVSGCEGVVLEVGLGKGRTYDFLRSRIGARGILVFDMWLRVGADLAPEEDRLFLGDFRDTLPGAAALHGRCARLAHADFGSPDRAFDREQAAWLAPLIDSLMVPGGIVVSDRPFDREGWTPVALPDTGDWPYHAWRVGGHEPAA